MLTPRDRHPDSGRQLIQGLSKIGLALRSEAWQAGTENGLSPTQQQILAQLAARSGGRRLAEIAAELGVRPATASAAVQTLVDKGLIRKQRARDDRRALALALTAAGKREAERVSGWSELMLSAALELSGDERDVFVRGLLKMIKRLQDEGRIATARMCASCVHFRPHAHPGSQKPHHCAFVDAAFADRDLRVDCSDQEARSDEDQRRVWREFVAPRQRGA